MHDYRIKAGLIVLKRTDIKIKFTEIKNKASISTWMERKIVMFEDNFTVK